MLMVTTIEIIFKTVKLLWTSFQICKYISNNNKHKPKVQK